MKHLTGKYAVITGGTDGIGAATARAMRDRGAEVVIIGRSPAKAASMEKEPALNGGSLRALTADFSSMTQVRSVVRQLAENHRHIDFLVHAVGILITKAQYTDEGLEKDFAVSYLSRYVFLEEAAALGLIGPATRMVNIAASAPEVPRYARMEFDDLGAVRARTGMKAHGQAQLANDLLTAQAADRYGITAVGYGPGAVNTSIRREVPKILQAVMKPFYARATRQPQDVAADLLALLVDEPTPLSSTTFANRNGRFAPSAYLADPHRQADLLSISEALARQAAQRG
ncbi:SDR family NAD(P)-dependent oxidoreductase [Streptomyces sp. NPDC003456]|uniref:SDR family NAD(P)-dependent oxidoreductase n=1 Tax=Streptomyces sp. NPDC003456 TaxID=3364683 RepID=UPI0036A1619A